MNFKKLLGEFIKEYYSSKEEKGFNEFRYRSSLHFLISLEVAFGEYSKNEMSYEMLCDKIPRFWGSRTTIFSILNHGMEAKFFEKIACKKDKRIRLYKLNSHSRVSMEKWLKNRKTLYLENN